MSSEENKRVTGLYGEMCLAMKLHEQGWQVYRAYIDENVDFVLCKYYCTRCNTLSEPEKRQKRNKQKKPISGNFPTNLCAKCKTQELIYIVRFVQVKTSVGIPEKLGDNRNYSFHAKLRSNIDPRAFYAWIALTETEDEADLQNAHFYIFHHSDINQFDDLTIDSYQHTDNQKTTLKINQDGKVLNTGRIYDFACFNHQFHNNFAALDNIMQIDIPRTA